MTNELEIMHTRFKKHIGKLATYRIQKNTDITEEIITNRTHAQIDFILINNRWKNSITNAESDTRANINTDHFPLIFVTGIKLKNIKARGKGRPMYKPCNANTCPKTS